MLEIIGVNSTSAIFKSINFTDVTLRLAWLLPEDALHPTGSVFLRLWFLPEDALHSTGNVFLHLWFLPEDVLHPTGIVFLRLWFLPDIFDGSHRMHFFTDVKCNYRLQFSGCNASAAANMYIYCQYLVSKKWLGYS
jgi:hypothetical protein